MKNLVLLALALLALTACDQGSGGKSGGNVHPENSTCEAQLEKATTPEQVLVGAYRLKTCGFTEEKAVSLLE